MYRGFPGSSNGKESACNAGDLGSIPGLGRSSGKGNGYPSIIGLENPMDCSLPGSSVHRISRVKHDLATKAPPPPVFLSGKFQGQRSLVGYSPWGHKESETTERLTLSFTFSAYKLCLHYPIIGAFELWCWRRLLRVP